MAVLHYMFFLDYLLPFFIALTVLVFIHELGHYWPARYFGVKVEVFSIGFGPEIFGFNDKHGTRWKFSLIPLGGYVRMFGDADAASRPDSDSIAKMSEAEHNLTLNSKPVMQRIIVSLGGPLANFIFAIAALCVLFALKGHPTIPAKISEIKPDSIAMTMGIQPGDEIVRVNDTAVKDFNELRKELQAITGNTFILSVHRGKSENVQLRYTAQDTLPKPLVLGVAPSSEPVFEKRSIVESALSSVTVVYNICADILTTLKETIMGQRKGGDLGGILAIGEMAGKSAQASYATFLWFLALLSVNLGLLNLFPIPMLDGGHIVLYMIEGIVGRPVPLKVQEYIFTAGFVLVISLMLFVTWNDLGRYKIFEMIRNLF